MEIIILAGEYFLYFMILSCNLQFNLILCRFETRSYQTTTNKTPAEIAKINEEFARMNVSNHDGAVTVIDGGSGMMKTQKKIESKTVTTTESRRMEVKSENRSYRLQ